MRACYCSGHFFCVLFWLLLDLRFFFFFPFLFHSPTELIFCCLIIATIQTVDVSFAIFCILSNYGLFCLFHFILFYVFYVITTAVWILFMESFVPSLFYQYSLYFFLSRCTSISSVVKIVHISNVILIKICNTTQIVKKSNILCAFCCVVTKKKNIKIKKHVKETSQERMHNLHKGLTNAVAQDGPNVR